MSALKALFRFAGRRAAIVGFLTVTMLAGGMSIAGQVKDGPNIDESAKIATPGPVARLAAAYELFAKGRSQGDPILVIAAARLAAAVPTRSVKRDAQQVGGIDSKQSGATNPPNIGDMIKAARDLAGSDRALNAIIDDVEATRPKGRTRGPGRAHGAVKAMGKAVFTGKDTVFRGGEVAEIAVVGDGDTNLDLHVFDELNNEICSSTKYTDREYCRWTPKWTGPFRIEVRNRSPLASKFTITVN
jgi:hypothetical protein